MQPDQPRRAGTGMLCSEQATHIGLTGHYPGRPTSHAVRAMAGARTWGSGGRAGTGPSGGAGGTGPSVGRDQPGRLTPLMVTGGKESFEGEGGGAVTGALALRACPPPGAQQERHRAVSQ
jgi:hypothetical protein